MRPMLERFRAAVLRQARIGGPGQSEYRESIWKRLPPPVFVEILASCDLADIGSLALSCRLLHQRIVDDEFAISLAYIQRRRQQKSQGSDGDIGSFYEIISPGDDLTFISGLFPPPPPRYIDDGDQNSFPEYSFAYLADLNRCWTTCIHLSYHLADNVVRHYLRTDTDARSLRSSFKTEKEVTYSKLVGMFQTKLLCPIAYSIFFFESYADVCPDNNYPGQAYSFSQSVERQESILQRPPFTDTRVLLSTHHCMQLLCSTIQRLMTPDILHPSSESWVSLLLTTSTLERFLGFFIAIAKDEGTRESTSHDFTWSHRREFIWRMGKVWAENVASCGDPSGNRANTMPSLKHVWFKAAYNEMAGRGAIPHTSEDWVPLPQGFAVTLQCKYCQNQSYPICRREGYLNR